MQNQRIAVIDLGSNTFHLLICETCKDNTWKEIHKEREYVKLASGGIHSIDHHAEQRALDAMKRFMNLIKTHQVEKVRAIGTAALREAENGPELAEKITAITGINVEIIDGHQEAQYILQGIKSAIPDLDEYRLIMDIGGGSVEFILYKNNDTLFTGSFKIGMAVLFSRFHTSDPISGEEIAELEGFLSTQLSGILGSLASIKDYGLIGASGAFEVLLEEMPKRQEEAHWAELEIEGVFEMLNKIIATTLEERKLMPEIPEERLDYIVVAYVLIRYLFKTVPPKRLYYCDYALKEGVIVEMMKI